MLPPKPKRGRPISDKRKKINIAATIDYRGENDNRLFFLFRGASQQLLVHIFRYLVGGGHGIGSQAIVTEEQDIVRRNGKGFWRMAVEIDKPNYNFCSLPDMQILIEALFHREYPCSFSWMPIETFLNV